MKTIGLIGGMSWESTVEYYKIINEVVKTRCGGLHSAKCLLYSVDFDEIERCQALGEWEKSGRILGEVAKSLERGGADFILLCTNTMHKVVNYIEEAVSIPVLHIAKATADCIKKESIHTIGLLGTKYTMEEDFYKSKLEESGLTVLIPDPTEREFINNVIYEELCLGKIVPDSKEAYHQIIRRLSERGAQGIILGCTEIGLLVKQEETEIPLFDTTTIHAIEAVNMAL